MLLGGPSNLSPGGPRPLLLASRAGSDWAAEESGALARLSGSALHLLPPPGARELCGSPPSALCYSPTSCLWSPTRAHFPGREAAEGREFLGDTPTGSRPLPPPCLPRLFVPPPPLPPAAGSGVSSGLHGGTAGQPPDTRGRCAAAQAAVPQEAPGDQSRNPELVCTSAQQTWVLILYH